MSIKKNYFAPLASGLGASVRRAAMLLLVMMLTATTAWATTTSTINVGGTDYTRFTGFTATAGTNASAAAYNYPNLVDGNLEGSSSWHLNDDAQPYYIEFNSDDPIIPKGYIFNTYAADNFKPTDWVLKAKADAGDSWTTLSSKSGQSLASGQEFQYACDNNGNNTYKYFRFEVSNNSNNIWLTEIRLYGNMSYTHISVKAATCTETGIKQECWRRTDGKYFTDETGTTELAESDVIAPMIPHNGQHHDATDTNIEYWQCSVCGKYFSDSGCTTEITEAETQTTVFGTLADGCYTLTSQTYTLTEDVNTARYIYVPEGVTATIDLNGHTIDRGLTSAVTNGMVIWVAGNLTVTDSGTGGIIKGGMDNSPDHVSCVWVYSDNGGAAFTLQGGTLIGNTNTGYNKAVFGANNTNITISGGKITNDATGIYSFGNITVLGGEISGNTTGILSQNHSVSVSGNPVITNNTNTNVEVYCDASVLNITGELTAGASISITPNDIPTANAPVTVTSGYGTYNTASPDTYFTLDNNSFVLGWNENRTEVAVGTELYTVGFDMNGHGTAIDAISVLSGCKLMKPEPTADGWYFVGWYTNAACTSGNEYDFDDVVTSNMTLHALWTQEAIYSFTLPEKMVIVSADHEAVGGRYPVGTVIRFKAAPDYVVDGDVSDGTNTLSADGEGIYTVTITDADITITATLKKAVEPNKTLSGSESCTAQDGDVLTGSTSGTVTIPNNAKITLSDVTINGGIVCEGTAEITLVGTNSVTGATNMAGIQVGGSGTTLTIKGNGSLTANGGNQSAGIGLSRAWDVNATGGDIVIEGGTITANGSVNGQWGAGIGTGVIFGGKTARLGNITIKGGSVKATGGSEADGIGTGYTYPQCTNAIGTVTIYDGIDKVDASSIKNSGSIVYKHEENDVTASKTEYFTIIENGNRRIIVQKVTPTIADVPDQTYTGSAITPEPLVTAGSLSLTKGTDYVYSYTNNTNVGTATVRATFQGDYESLGYVEKEFTILPSTVMVSVTGSGTVTCSDRSATDGTSFGVMSEKGASVVLTLAPTDGYAVRSVEYGYTNSNETTMNGAKLPISGTTATLTVPGDLKDGTGVTVTVTFAPALNGGADEASAVALTDATVTDLGGGWYKVENNITFDHTLNLLADTYLTIAEGKTMTVNTAGEAIDSEYTLNVSGEGALNITTTEANKIAVRVGSYVQTGATVTASGYIGIRCMDNFEEFNVTNDFTFSGGQLTATGSGGDGIDADNDITLSCTNATDFIQASSYSSKSGAVKIAEGKALTDGTEASDGMNGYSGTLTTEQITAIGGKTLHRAVTTSYVEANGTLHENVIAIPLDNTMTTLPAGTYVVNEDVNYTGRITLSGDVTLILGDGCTMSFGKEGELLDGTFIECNSHNLTIYGQSGGTGWLKAYSAQDDGINNVDYYTQYSGNVVIFDGNNACINAREFTILGGTLDLESVGGAYGEIVTTENINIRGGKLWARCKGLKTMSGMIILDYTNATDQINVKAYDPQNGLEIADGKTLVDDYGVIWSGALNNEQIVHGINDRTLKPLDYTGVTLTKEGNNVSATFSGSSETTVSIPVDVTVNSVTYNRAFTMDKPSTVMLPFSKDVGEISGGTFYTFGGVKKENNKWVATMNAVTGLLTANTPYLFVPTGTSLTFTGGATLNTTGGGNCLASDTEGWEFHGTYSKKLWNEVETHDYGFAATSGTSADDKSVEAGQFVRLTTGASAKPMRCYLSYVGVPNQARALTRGAAATDEELPQSIIVRLVGANGQTTAIGTIDTKTGEMTFDSEAWYTLDGVRLSGKPTKKGLYINNGKKIVIK